MPQGEFELREIEWTTARVAVVVLMLVVATLDFAIATTTRQHRFAVLGLGLLGCLVVFFTDLWRPGYHLVGALYVCTMATVWFVSGMPMSTVSYVDAAMKVALVGVFLYLLFADRRAIGPDGAEG